jgi:phosphoribulokinase
LTRRFPRQTFVAVTLPVVVESFVSDAIEAALLHDAPLLVAGIIGALIAATAGAIVGLTEVSLAFQLITHDNASQTGTARAARQTPA